jgi:hypothetical protein
MAAAKRFDDHGSFVALQTVGIAGVRRARDFFIKCPGVEGYDYRRALRHKRANPAGMIEMVVSRDRIANRFSGEPLFDRLDHRRGASLVQRPFDGDQMGRASRLGSSHGSHLEFYARRARVAHSITGARPMS